MNTNERRLHSFLSIRVHSWFFFSFKAVAMVLFLDGGILVGLSRWVQAAPGRG
jgi:hypothetical protein